MDIIMVVGPCAGGELPGAGQLRPSIIIVQAIHAIFCIDSITLLFISYSVNHQFSHTSQTTHTFSQHGASRSQRLHPPNRHTANTRSPHSPSASSLTRATPSKPPSLPQHPPPPVCTIHCARTNPSTHPTTPRPPSQQSPPHTLWKHASTTGALPKMPSR